MTRALVVSMCVVLGSAVAYAGTIEGNAAMKGTVTFAGLGGGTFTAKR